MFRIAIAEGFCNFSANLLFTFTWQIQYGNDWKLNLILTITNKIKLECITVGCVPPAAVAVRGGLHTPHGTRHPPGADTLPKQTPYMWAWRPPSWPDPPQLPPWVWAWKPARHAGIPPPSETCCKACWDTTCNACWDTTPLPCEQNHRRL